MRKPLLLVVAFVAGLAVGWAIRGRAEHQTPERRTLSGPIDSPLNRAHPPGSKESVGWKE